MACLMFEIRHGHINLNLYHAQSLFVIILILVCDFCSFNGLISKKCRSVHTALLHVRTLKEIKKSPNCTFEWNEKMLSTAKQ